MKLELATTWSTAGRGVEVHWRSGEVVWRLGTETGGGGAAGGSVEAGDCDWWRRERWEGPCWGSGDWRGWPVLVPCGLMQGGGLWDGEGRGGWGF